MTNARVLSIWTSKLESTQGLCRRHCSPAFRYCRFALAAGARSRSLACLPSNIMSASAPHLTELPTETLEYVLLRLPVQDVIKMEVVRSLSLTPREWLLMCCIQVNRRFQDLIRNSPTLQLRRELFAAGLIENLQPLRFGSKSKAM